MIRPGPKALIGRKNATKVIIRRGRPEDNMIRNRIVPLFARVSIESFITSARVKARGVTPGIADVLCGSPRLGFRFDFEGKLPGKRQDHEQLRYQEFVEGSGGVYVLGDVVTAEDFLVHLGLCRVLDRPHSVTKERIVQPREPREWPVPDAVAMLAQSWKRTPMYRDAQDRFGWKPTVGALKKYVRRMR